MTKKIDVAKVVIENERNEILILKKSSDYEWKADHWELPGGKLEENEDRYQASQREVLDETELNVSNLEDLVRMEIESELTVNCYCLYTEDFSGKTDLSDEHQSAKWVSKEEIRNVEWHRDAAYIIPVIEHLDEYLEKENNY